jgi:hypothetical protein
MGWLDAHGITLSEAARIQVPYWDPGTPAEQARNTAFGIAAPVALGTAMIATATNLIGNRDGRHPVFSLLGLVGGAASVAVGARLMNNTDFPSALGRTSAAIGGISMGVSLHALVNRHRSVVAQKEAAARRTVVRATIAPLVARDGLAGAAVALAVRF